MRGAARFGRNRFVLDLWPFMAFVAPECLAAQPDVQLSRNIFTACFPG